MPKSIQIRDVPDDVHATLRIRAAGAGLSLSDYLRNELIDSANRATVADVLSRVESRQGGATREQIVKAIRDMRDDRDL